MKWAVYDYERSEEEKLEEQEWIVKKRYESEKILRNKYRAGILYLLAKYHVLTPSKIAFKLGAYPRTIMHHLDKLIKLKLVKVHSLDERGYRESFRLNERMPSWVEFVIKNILLTHGKNTLEKISSADRYMRGLGRRTRVF